MARVDPESLKVLDVVRVHPAAGGALRVTGDVFLARIDSRTGNVTTRLRPPT